MAVFSNATESRAGALADYGSDVLGLSETAWEKAALTRWGSYLSCVEMRAILRAQELAGAPTNALEVGCEGGRWSLMLSQLGWRMTCVDVDQKALAVCQKRVPTASCVLADPNARRIPCDSSSFDLLLCIEVAPVIQSDWFLPEAHRVLKEDGVFVGVTWNRASVRGILARTAQRLRRTKRDFYKLSYPTWRRTLVSAHFRLVYQEGFCWGPFGRSSNSLLVPLFVKVERLLQLNRLPSVSPWVAIIARKVS